MYLFLRNTSAWRHLCRFFLPSLFRTGPSPWISSMHTSTFLFIRNRADFLVFNTRIAPSIIRFSPLVFGIPPGFLPVSLPRLDFPRQIARPADHQIGVPHPIGLPPSCFPLSSCSPLAAVSGAPCQSQGLGSRLSLPFASSPDLFSAPLPSPSGLPRPPDPVVSGDQSLLFGVGVSRVSSCGEILCSPSSLVHPDHGRVQLRLGRFSSPTSSFRTVVSSGSSPSYQPTGTEGCFLGSPRFPSPSDGSFGPGQVRQFDSGCLHKPPGRYSIRFLFVSRLFDSLPGVVRRGLCCLPPTFRVSRI